MKTRISQWEPPQWAETDQQPDSETSSESSDDDEDEEEEDESSSTEEEEEGEQEEKVLSASYLIRLLPCKFKCEPSTFIIFDGVMP
jgi:hypothetical protein